MSTVASEASASAPQDSRRARDEALARMFGAVSVEGVLAHFRSACTAYGVRDFALYTLAGDIADLAMSVGSADPLHAQGDRLSLKENPALADFLATEEPYGIPDDDGGEAPQHASGIFRVRFQDEDLGFIVTHGVLPEELFEDETIASFLQVIEVFSAAYYKAHTADSLSRAYGRTLSRLQELQEGQDILLLSDKTDILSSILKRALNVLGSQSGMVWLREDDEWKLSYMDGMPSMEGLAEMEAIIHRCCNQGRAALVSSLSGEVIWNLDAETIHMASIAVFPLVSRSTAIGCIAAFDATVSQDAADIVGGTCLVGAIAVENWLSRQQMLDQQRMEEQLSVAAKAQQRLLPTKEAEYTGMSVAYFSRYCDETGGDYVDALSYLDRNISTLIVGDVSGHGLGAAMLMVDVRARIRTQLEQRGMLPTPEVVLNRVNRVLLQESAEEEFVTLFLCNIDTRTGKMFFANAGHEPPLLYRPEEKRWIELESTGLPLGLVDDEEITLAVENVQRGDVIVFATDGVTEAENTQGVAFGTDEIISTVESMALEDTKTILEALVTKTLKHCENRAFIDDVTYLVAKVDHINLRMDDKAPPAQGEEIYACDFPSTRDEKDQVLSNVIEMCLDRFPEEDLNGLFMSAEEALTNAVVHGNAENPDKTVKVALHADGEQLSLTISDEGRGFKPIESVPNFNNEETLAMESGRGLMMMASLMDEVIYWDEGRSVLIRKMLGVDGGEGE